MSRQVSEATIRKTDDGNFHAFIEYFDGDERVEADENFDSFEEANAWLQAQESGSEQTIDSAQPAAAAAEPSQDQTSLDEAPDTSSVETDATAASNNLQSDNEQTVADQAQADTNEGNQSGDQPTG